MELLEERPDVTHCARTVHLDTKSNGQIGNFLEHGQLELKLKRNELQSAAAIEIEIATT